MTNWQPIETVPKDEDKSFLVMIKTNDIYTRVIMQASWFEGQMYPDAFQCVIDYDDGILNATHWMPLPEPPKE